MRTFIAFVVLLAVLVIGVPYYASRHEPPCQTFWNAQFTGKQVIGDHRVRCFHGQIVRVYP